MISAFDGRAPVAAPSSVRGLSRKLRWLPMKSMTTSALLVVGAPEPAAELLQEHDGRLGRAQHQARCRSSGTSRPSLKTSTEKTTSSSPASKVVDRSACAARWSARCARRRAATPAFAEELGHEVGVAHGDAERQRRTAALRVPLVERVLRARLGRDGVGRALRDRTGRCATGSARSRRRRRCRSSRSGRGRRARCPRRDRTRTPGCRRTAQGGRRRRAVRASRSARGGTRGRKWSITRR